MPTSTQQLNRLRPVSYTHLIVRSQIEAVADVLGGKSISSSDYTGWEFKKESTLRDLAIEKYEKMCIRDRYGIDP